MKQHNYLFLACALLLGTIIHAQQDTATVNKMLAQSKITMGADPMKSIEEAEAAIKLAERIDFPVGAAMGHKQVGIVYYMQAKYSEALDQWMQSLSIFEKANDENGIANILNNIAAIYKERGVDDKALEYALRSLSIAEKIKNKTRIYSALITIASVYQNKKDPKAIEYMQRAHAIADPEGLGLILANIGELLFEQGEKLEKVPDSAAAVQRYFRDAFDYYQRSIAQDAHSVSTAFSYNGIGKVHFKNGQYNEAIASHAKAMALAEKVEDKWNLFKANHGTANVYMQQKNYGTALGFYNSALAFAEQVGNNDLSDLYKDMAHAYLAVADYRNAYAYQEKFTLKEKEIYNEQVQKKLGTLQLDWDLDKKQAENARLTAEKKVEAQFKKGFATVAVLVFFIAVILYRNYRAKHRINKVLDKQKAEIETLLLNILPQEVAQELQQDGKATPRHYDNASVLFTDFKNFTSMADKMPPREVVAQLNSWFIAFDNIVERYGLEKIKTIGDSYMCAGGIPVPDKEHAYKIVQAAVAMQKWSERNNAARVERGMEPLEIRIGIHSGPLVAGVVGRKKYAYDIWGSTVNIASRMESNGEAGRVNISAALYEQVKDRFQCSHRGKIHAKNVGEVDMYFVEAEIGAEEAAYTMEDAVYETL
jgi:adenylate cyclase